MIALPCFFPSFHCFSMVWTTWSKNYLCIIVFTPTISSRRRFASVGSPSSMALQKREVMMGSVCTSRSVITLHLRSCVWTYVAGMFHWLEWLRSAYMHGKRKEKGRFVTGGGGETLNRDNYLHLHECSQLYLEVAQIKFWEHIRPKQSQFRALVAILFFNIV